MMAIASQAWIQFKPVCYRSNVFQISILMFHPTLSVYLLQNFNGVSMLPSYQGEENTSRRYKNHALTYLLVSVPGAILVSQRS